MCKYYINSWLILLLTLLSKTQQTKATDAGVTEFPQQVAIRYKSCENCAFIHVCSGTFYNESIVLSVASCFKNISVARNYFVVAGSNVRDSSKGYVTPVSRIVKNSHFKEGEFQNDLALIFLVLPLRFREGTTASATLATQLPTTGVEGIVAGWRKDSMAGDWLQKTSVAYLNQENCQENFDILNDNILCAINSEKNICEFGAGSLFFVRGELFGILSENAYCNEQNIAFTNIVFFKDWMERVINGELEQIETILKPDFL